MKDRQFLVKWKAGKLTVHAKDEHEAQMIIVEYIRSEAKNLISAQALEEETVVKELQ